MATQKIESLSREIDNALVKRFSRSEKTSESCQLKIPTRVSEKEIEHISDIPEIAMEIRKLKYGPKLKINGSFITTQYRAGFHGTSKDVKYAESLFIHFSDSSYPAINDLFSDNTEQDNKALGSVLTQLANNAKNGANFIDTNLMIDSFSQAEAKKTVAPTKPANSSTSPQAPEFSDEFLQESLKNMKIDPKNLKNRAIYSFSTKVPNHVDAFCSKVLELGDPKLSDRILAVWFLAESFRYPPMLFYSIAILHCYFNGYITLQELRDGFHPSQKKGSQQAQFFCYAVKSGYSLESINGSSTRSEMEELCKANNAILQRLYDKVKAKLSDKGYKDEALNERAEKMFNLHIRYYLKLCGLNFNDIVNFRWPI